MSGLPTLSQVHVSQPLTNISVAYVQDTAKSVAMRVFPTIPTDKQADEYFVYSKEDMLRIDAGPRAPGAQAPEGGVGLTTSTFHCTRDAIARKIPDPIRANADAALDMDRDATVYVTQQLLMKQDQRWAQRYFKTGVWTTDLDGVASGVSTNEFLRFDASGAKPIVTITEQLDAVEKLTGLRPNKAVLGMDVYTVLRNHTDMLGRIQYVERAIIREQEIAAILGLDEVIVARMIYNSAPENAAGTYAPILDPKDALLVYSESSPGLLKPSAGYTFSWRDFGGNSDMGMRIKKFRIDERYESDWVEGEMWYDPKLVAADLGVFMEDAVG
jgi:hypothetical protein